MKIAFFSFEVYPLAKVGGLADVVGSLPKFLKREGQEVFIVMPFHKVVERNIQKYNLKVEKVLDAFKPSFVSTNQTAEVYKTNLPNTDVEIYLVKNDYYFSAEQVYSSPDSAEQSIFFCSAGLDVLKKLDKKVDIIHSHDWQTALIPVYFKANYKEDQFFKDTASVFTIHNLGYQGIFDKKYLDFAGLPWYLYNIDALEFYSQLNFLKGGIVFSDMITTVSPTYSEEIRSEEYGEKLHDVLRIRGDSLVGILNGIDYEEYNPETDKRIKYNYNSSNLEGKYKNKTELQRELGLEETLEKPLFGFIGRLVDQKGLDLLSEIIDYLIMYDTQFVLLGTGDPKYEKIFEDLNNKYPSRMAVKITFDIELAQRIYAGCDMFLMPSRYEPCGLGQMYSLRYGTIPIVRYTGGLADTVFEYNPEKMEGNGFGFKDYKASDFLMACSRGIYFFKNEKNHWRKIIENAMSTDVSWDKSAREYIKVYNETVNRIRNVNH
jgi:starch synthase